MRRSDLAWAATASAWGDCEGLMTLEDILSSPTRREILILLRDGELRAGDVSRTLRRGAPCVSNHLHLLSHVGLVLCRHVGPFRYYRLNAERAVAAWDAHLQATTGASP